MPRPLALIAFLVLTVGGGALIGLTVETGGWFSGLDKPAFNPATWIFAPVWTVLYILIGIAGWRVWRAKDKAMQGLWWLQLALNFVWPPIFFTAHALGWALAVIIALLAAIAGFTGLCWRRERTAAWLFLPYLVWVAYATLLNAALWWMN
ncbi:tryptophan-rich sensory protein [Jiella sp. MQZ9-1]|uniref:Tryptophan-rich sensory protein n=1 Tax=Jiella flava TaxID=2816857 RepID=A0A939JVI2_9HYPH|nr:TspO/MBR family protein [Jiella flava]MBO0662494.1 tryptophan-rich sensory protein [Jiella flava]MCD2471719.1 tryptophan-rich sensory protein [Jiella flava]